MTRLHFWQTHWFGILHSLTAKKGITTIDFETAVEVYIELKKGGPYKEDALELLAGEIYHSEIITLEDKDFLEKVLPQLSEKLAPPPTVGEDSGGGDKVQDVHPHPYLPPS